MSSDPNPYQPPTSPVDDLKNGGTMQYVGFWPRVGASIIDTILMVLVLMPLFFILYGTAYFDPEGEIVITQTNHVLSNVLSTVVPAIVVIIFWIYRAATPGKMVVSAIIVDAETGEKASTGQMIGRYLSYFISSFVLGLGFLWVAFDKRKQGWHDKLAGTVVIKKP